MEKCNGNVGCMFKFKIICFIIFFNSAMVIDFMGSFLSGKKNTFGFLSMFLLKLGYDYVLHF